MGKGLAGKLGGGVSIQRQNSACLNAKFLAFSLFFSIYFQDAFVLTSLLCKLVLLAMGWE